MRTISFTPVQVKRIKLEAHYDLYEELFGDKFDTPFVAGVGDLNAKVVLVGEAPGRTETEQGKPFVGASGKMLNKGLRSVGIERPDVFITNFLKYQPPANRDPEGDEVPVCLNMLRKELAIIGPRIVVPLGRFSTSLFFESPHMGSLVGQVWIKHGYTVIPMYHPASVMYGGYDREDWYKHFRSLRDCLKKPPHIPSTNGNGKPVRKRLRPVKV